MSKKIQFSVVLVAILFASIPNNVSAQNSFPDSSVVTLDGFSININEPSVSSWARGLNYYDNLGVKTAGIGLFENLTTKRIFIGHGTEPWTGEGIFLKTDGKVGIGTTDPSHELEVNGGVKVDGSINVGGSTTLDYPGRYYIERSNVTSEMFIATNGQGSGWMVNATYGGSGNPQDNSTYSIDPGQHNASAGYLDFDGNGKNWSFNLSASSPGIGSPVSWSRVAYFDNSEIKLSPNGNSTDFTLLSDGKLGLGTDTPDSRLHIKSGSSGGNPNSISELTVERSEDAMISILTPNDKLGYFGFADNDDNFVGGIHYDHSTDNMYFRVNNHSISDPDLTILSTGNVGIGTISPSYKFEVNGTIRSKEVIVEATNWPDYVFEEGYNLLSLAEIEAFIKANKHLPEVPSAEAVEKDGVMVGEMNALLLKKIEELTLHVIDIKKENTKLKERLEIIENKEEN